MKSIQSAVRSYLNNTGKKPSSERAYTIQIICEDMFTQKHFERILGQTKEMTVSEIREIYDTAKSWKTNPPALFWKLVKEKRSQIKTDLKKAAKKQQD